MSNKSTLSLKLQPEVAKIIPWIISAKASGKPKDATWAKREYEIAQALARERERHEAWLEERRLEKEWRQKLQLEEEERDYQAWLADQELQQKRLDACNAHVYTGEDGSDDFLPSQNSTSGGLRREWARMQEEGLRDKALKDRSLLPYMARSNERYGKNRHHRKRTYRDHSHNCGRKPRTFRDH
jgi:hypothetical protein